MIDEYEMGEDDHIKHAIDHDLSTEMPEARGCSLLTASFLHSCLKPDRPT